MDSSVAAADARSTAQKEADPRAPTRAGSERSPAFTAGVVLLALAAVGGAAWMLWQGRPDQRFQDALAALEAKDYERVNYDMIKLRAAGRHYEPHASLLQGALLAKRGQFQEALSELRYASDNPQTKAMAFELGGECLYSLGSFREAERMLQSALKENPNSLDAHRWLAIAYYDQGMMKQAMVHLSRIRELDPSDSRPYHLMGLIYNKFGEYKEAIESLQKAIKMAPPDFDVQEIRTELARALLQQHQYDDILATLKEARDTVEVLTLRAECYIAQKRFDDAKESLRLAEKRKQEDVDGLTARAKLAQDAGEVDLAAKILRLAEEKKRDDLNVLIAKATLAQDAGNVEEAVEFLKDAEKTHPNSLVVHYRLAQLYQRLEKSNEAKRHLKRSEQLQELHASFKDLQYVAAEQPHDPKVRFQIGELAAHLDMLDIAKVWFKSAIALDPNYQDAYTALQAIDPDFAPTPTDGAGMRP